MTWLKRTWSPHVYYVVSTAAVLLRLLEWNPQTAVWSSPTDFKIDVLWNAVSGTLGTFISSFKETTKEVAICTARGQQHWNCQEQQKLMKSGSLNVCEWWNNTLLQRTWDNSWEQVWGLFTMVAYSDSVFLS